MQSVDIAIIGGGMVGLALAAAFKESKGCALQSLKAECQKHNGELPDVRVSALSRSSEIMLRKLGAWQGIIERRAAAYQSMEAWAGRQFCPHQF